MTVLLIVALSPFGEIAITSIMFCPSEIEAVSVKSPFEDGVITSSNVSVMTATTALLFVLPDIIKILLVTTSSSFGRSKVKKIDGAGIGVGVVKEITFVLEGAAIFVV